MFISKLYSINKFKLRIIYSSCTITTVETLKFYCNTAETVRNVLTISFLNFYLKLFNKYNFIIVIIIIVVLGLGAALAGPGGALHRS